jgi:hypothetical protein
MPPKKATRQPARQQTKPRAAQTRRPTGPGVPTQVLTDGTLPAEELGAENGATNGTLVAPPPARTTPPRAAAAAPPRAAAVPPRRTPAAGVGSGIRAMRGRVAQQLQVMDLREEMAWIRSDITHLTVLSVAGFVILIVLAFVLPMLGF